MIVDRNYIRECQSHSRCCDHLIDWKAKLSIECAGASCCLELEQILLLWYIMVWFTIYVAIVRLSFHLLVLEWPKILSLYT